MEKYNGWTNYETWLMAINLTNDEVLYNECLNIIKNGNDISEKAQLLKEFVEDTFYVEKYGIYKIEDKWTTRDFNEINWEEIAESLSKDLSGKDTFEPSDMIPFKQE